MTQVVNSQDSNHRNNLTFINYPLYAFFKQERVGLEEFPLSQGLFYAPFAHDLNHQG